jgi:hypothetical protein
MNNAPFYLGRIFDPQQGKTTDRSLEYEPEDLTTHAVVMGMTGSGKTGLCIGLLEEAALNGIPALMIDPKGDITNLLLHFPDLLPRDFQPWVNADQARREGKTLEQAAEEASTQWRDGLASWGIGNERLRLLQNSAQFTVYTPGSDAGIPVSILASLKCPPLPWEGNREVLREKISGTVTALLGLVGLGEVDPVRSREHILLSNIFESAWSQGKDLDLGELILQTQSPPFPKLGVFDVNAFFPEKDRFGLAMLLNNILAAPAFQIWVEGEPLDIATMLFTPDGRPRHSIFYIAHLNDSERMFFITLLYSAVESWMRAQSGTTSLRAIVYFDEIFGYLPPLGNPPSKQPMLRMLKQARAFGVGQVLVTQNPVDVDYKGLSNAGTWLIGKLQTDQDKQRLLDGLQSAMAGGWDRAEYDRLISALGKRVFLMHNVHAKASVLFQTRWAMNYLAGPLTRTQIPELNKLGGAVAVAPAVPPHVPQQAGPVGGPSVGPVSASAPSAGVAAASKAPVQLSQEFSSTRLSLPAGVKEYILPNNLTFTQAFKAAGRAYPQEAFSQGLVYRPVILAQAEVRFLNRKYNLDETLTWTAIVANPDRRGVVRWEEHDTNPVDTAALESATDPEARFARPEAPFIEAKIMAALERDFEDWVYRSAQVSVRANEALKLYAGPQVSSAEFLTQCSKAAREGRDDEARKIEATYDKKLDSLKVKQSREQRELDRDESEFSQRKMEESGTHLANVASLFGFGRKRSLTSSLTKRRLTEEAKADVEESKEAIEEMQQQIAALEKEKADALEEVNQRWSDLASQITEIPIAAMKKDVLLDLFGVAWMPYHLVKAGGEEYELPGYGED